MKKTTSVMVLALFLIISSSVGKAFADAIPEKGFAYLKPDVTIEVGGQVKSFYDVNGYPVYPIIYQGSTYLPVRAISGLMEKGIEWDNTSKTVFIGKTLSDPLRIADGVKSASVKDGGVPKGIRPPVQMVEVYIKPDVTIMYDFVVQQFADESGNPVYPIIYQGSTYLPVRSAAKLMGEEITWDQGAKRITISDNKSEPGEEPQDSEESQDAANENVENLKTSFNSVVAVYDEATAKITNIQNAGTIEELELLAASVNEDSRKAKRLTTSIKNMSTSGFSVEEEDAYNKLVSFAESSEHYILMIENIAYMAAHEQDYSVLAETFLTFALDSQSKLDKAKQALDAL